MERNRTHPMRVVSRKRHDFPSPMACRLLYSGVDAKRPRIYYTGVEEAQYRPPSNLDTLQYARSPQPNRNGIYSPTLGTPSLHLPSNLDTLEYIRVPHPKGVTNPTVGPGSNNSPSGFDTLQYSPSDFDTIKYVRSNAKYECQYPIRDAPLPFPDHDLGDYNQFGDAEYSAYLRRLNGRQLLHSVASVDSPVSCLR
jgi:hypothetical protein